MSKMTKKKKIVLISVLSSVAALLIATSIILWLVFRPVQIDPREELNSVSVCLEVPTDGSTPLDHTGIENIGYMNWQLQQQSFWYSEMSGTVDNWASKQTISTFKQYYDGVMIATDIATSNLVNSAEQYCIVGETILMRGTTRTSDFDGINTKWPKGQPVGYNFADFKAAMGLPHTEFSVFILNEKTILNCSEVIDNGDGTFTQTFELNMSPDPSEENDAGYYYKQQMIYKGGLSGEPEFNECTVTYTFDNQWHVLVCENHEDYKVKKGIISSSCTLTGRTDYRYDDEELCYNSDFEEYFAQYVEGGYSSSYGKKLTAADCLAEAFGGVMQEETALAVDLTLGEYNAFGAVQLNIPQNDIRVDLGNIKVYLRTEDNEQFLYIVYGENVKAKIALSDLASESAATAEEGEVEEENVIDSLLTALGDEDYFTYDEEGGRATISPTINLGELLGIDLDLVLSLEFQFNVAEDKSVTLDYVTANGKLFGSTFNAELRFADEGVAALAPTEAATFTKIDVAGIASLAQAEALQIKLEYSGYDVEVSGGITVNLDELQVKADLQLVLGGNADGAKQISLIYANDTMYAALSSIGEQPVKVKASAAEVAELIAELLGTTGTQDVDILQTVLDFIEEIGAGNLAEMLLAENGISSMLSLTGSEDALLTIDGTALCNLFGVDFELGTVVANIQKGGIVGLNALGLDATISGKEKFTFDKSDYQSATNLLPVVQKLISIFEESKLSINGTLNMQVGATSVVIDINLLSIDWTDGINVTLNSVLTVQNITQNLLVSYNGEIAKVSLGNMGIIVESADFDDVLAAVLDLVGAIGGEQISVPEMSAGEFDIISLVNSLQIGGEQNGIAKLCLFGFEIIIDQTDSELSVLGISASYEDSISLSFAGSLTYYQTAEYPDGDVEYFDVEYILPLINKVTGYLTEGKLTVTGSVEMDGITVTIDNLSISWVDGIEVAAQITLSIESFEKTIYVECNAEKIALYYDSIVIELAQDDFDGFIEAIQHLYAAIATEANMGGEVLLGTLDIDRLLSLLPTEGESVDIFEILSSIEFAKNENGNLVIIYNDLTLELIIATNGDLSANINYAQIAANAAVTQYSEVILPTNCSKLDVKEIIPLIEDISEIISHKGITVSGDLILYSGSTEIALTVYGLSIGWANGIELQLDARLEVDGEAHDFYAEYSTASGQLIIAYGALNSGAGIDINVVEDAATLEDALVALYNRIAGVVNKTGDVLPEVQNLEELLDYISTGMDGMSGVVDLAQTLEDITGESPSLWDILGSININAQGGMLNIDIGELSLILWRTGEQFNVSVHTLGVGIEIKNLQIVEREAINLDIQVTKALSANDIVDVLDYIGAAVELLVTDSLKIELSGAVTSTDEAYADVEGVKYNINAGFEYLQGESGFPVHIDAETPDFWIAPDIYVHLYVQMLSTVPEVDSLLLDAYILDGNPTINSNGKTTSAELTSGDNELDVYLSISKISQAQANMGNNGASQPLKIYAPMNEIMTVLSAGLALADVGSISIDALPELNDIIVQIGEILDIMLVDRYFGDTKDQFTSLGSGLIESIIGGSISDLINDLINGLVGNKEVEQGEDILPTAYGIAEDGLERERYGLVNLDISVENGTLALGVGGTTTNLTKRNGRLTSLTIDSTELNETETLNDLAIDISYAGIERVTELSGYTSFVGADELVKAIINSATHYIPEEEQTEKSAQYALNDNFFIDGELSVTVSLLGFNLTDHIVTIDGLSVIIDDDGEVEVNARLHYEGKHVLLDLVSGASTVDLSIKKGMVYIKRVQTNKYNSGFLGYGAGWENITPETIYRAMPIDVFMSDIMNQIFFMLNFSDTIMGLIPSDGGSNEPQPEVKKDYGTQLVEYFNYLKFTEDEEAGTAVWEAQINGTGISELAGISISDITATFNAEKDAATDCYVVNGLGLSGALFGLLQFGADLNWQNPQQNWRSDSAEALAEEIVQNNPSTNLEQWLGGTTFEEICKAIDWYALPSATDAGEKYAELTFTGDEELPSGKVKFGTVEYYLRTGDEEFLLNSVENILYSGTTLLSMVQAPDLTEFEQEHYTLEWRVSAFSGGLVYIAEYVPAQYQVTFISEYEIEGYTHIYGNTLTFNFNYQVDGHKIDYIEYKGVQYTEENYTDIIIDGDAEIYVHWVEVPYIAVSYYSELAFASSEEVSGVDGYEKAYSSTVKLSSDFSVADVSAEGYMFVGWYYLDETVGWILVNDILTDIPAADFGQTYELHALWIQANVTVNGTKSSGLISTSYNLDGAVEFEFFGNTDLLDELQVSAIGFRYYVNNSADYNATSSNKTDTVSATNQDGCYKAESNISSFSVSFGNYSYKHLAVSFTVTINGQDITCGGEYLHASSSNW